MEYSPKLKLPESNIDKINELPEAKTSRVNRKFHNKFFESHLKEPFQEHMPVTYYGTFYELSLYGKINKLRDCEKCPLLKDWVKFYNENLNMTTTSKSIKYVESSTECSIVID